MRGRQPAAAKPEKHVVCLGLSESGKSTALALLAGEPIDKIEPTDGFHIKDILLKDCILNVKEIGGMKILHLDIKIKNPLLIAQNLIQ